MKKILIAILLIAAVSVTQTQAQVDSIDVSAIAKDDTATLRLPDSSINPAAVAIDDTSAYEFEGYSMPYRNAIYYFGSPFCAHFAEMKFFIGKAFGFGANYTYLPEVWGIHGTVGTFIRMDSDISLYCNSLMLSAGPDYRLSKPWSQHDFHLFGSVGISCLDRDKSVPARPTLEAGIRMANAGRAGGFCINSGSLSVLTDFQTFYLTFGVSLSLSIVTSAVILLAVAN
ncbi:MAG: hypothetical protein MJZ45_01050 [Bacteroidales bacterium]|nr:hypothetical protein [Bacteroidales bacterium]